MRLGNIKFDQIEEHLGYRLTEEDRLIWDKYHNDNANLNGMKHCFHVFDIPRCIVVNSMEAGFIIVDMFTREKIVNNKGTFEILIQS